MTLEASSEHRPVAGGVPKGRRPVAGAPGSGAPRNPVLLTIEALTVSAGSERLLDGVSFEVAHGSTTAVVGANGAGKTTLLQTIAGVRTPAAGSIRFRGQELVGLPSHRICALGIAHVPEGGQLFATMSVRENLEIGAALPRARAGRQQRLEGVLALFPRLAGRLDFDAGQLSAGEQQMVAIGRCLMARPELILFDEPTRGLTPGFARQLFQLIGTLEAEGLTIILAEQNAPAALRLADSAHILDRGRLARSGPGLALLEAGRGGGKGEGEGGARPDATRSSPSGGGMGDQSTQPLGGRPGTSGVGA